MNRLIPTLSFLLFLLFSAFTTNETLNEKQPFKCISHEISFGDVDDDLMHTCCGTINIAPPVCSGPISFSFSLQPVGGGAATNLSIGSNQVEVNKGGRYILSYTTLDPGATSFCLPVSATYDLCGSSGTVVLDPSESIRAGKDDAICDGFGE